MLAVFASVPISAPSVLRCKGFLSSPSKFNHTVIDPERMITFGWNWLSTASKRKTIPGDRVICQRNQVFRKELLVLCRDIQIEEDELTFNAYTKFVSEWLKAAA